ncbi:hypothetical protein N7470_000728 [Penicillium chermesinum]|nr:hypothetical protein N7470_000728 [Penicillium chermesinum]
MTSYDRHASHDSPYRTGRHVPLNQSRHEPLTSIATSAIESRPDLSDPYNDEPSKGMTTVQSTECRPYSPGMRSLASQKRKSNDQDSAGEIQMQSFHDGAPPPPPVAHSWRKIERWLEDNFEELLDNLGEGCTQNDINELEHELDCSLPLELRESLMIHDGQERPGLPTGLLFSVMLLDCEEIVQERHNWKTVNEDILAAPMPRPPTSRIPIGAANFSSAKTPSLLALSKKAYAHPAWIPLARDWGGNHLAIDLAPGPAGKWGQVIIFGRDYDCKYVVARSWAAFLAMFADDLCSGRAHVDEETNEMKLLEFKKQNVEPPYLEILRWRVDQKYGRRPMRRRGPNGLGANANGKSSTRDSPYGSPTRAEERGRSPHRFPNRGPVQSPKTPFGISSPLARVTEESSAAGPSISEDPGERKEDSSDDLLDVNTPQVSNKENEGFAAIKGTEGDKADKSEGASSSSKGVDTEVLGEMKNVAI